MPPAKKKTAEDYVAALEDWRRPVVERLTAQSGRAAPHSTVSIKWAHPVFEDHGPFAYVHAYSKHINLGLWRGAERLDRDPRLQGGGETMAHIKITPNEMVTARTVCALVKAAVALDHAYGSPARGR